MNANQRRPGFRLPWSSEDEPGAEPPSDAPPSEGSAATTPAVPPAAAPAAPAAPAAAKPAMPASTPNTASPTPDAAAEPAAKADVAATETPTAETEAPAAAVPTAETPAPAPEAPAAEAPVVEPTPAAPADDAGDDFMRDLVSAMRRVAEETRDTGLADLRARADEQVRLLEADAERRQEDLRARAEADVDAVGEWAKAEAERITREAEQRVVARRAQLEQQLAGDTQRTEADSRALRERVSEYERELAAYHGQLSEIKDPAAFAAAAKRMPRAPELAPATPAPTAPEAPAPAADAPKAGSDDVPVEPSTAGSNGVPTPAADVHPAEEEVLAARLAQLDATLPQADAPSAGAATSTEPITTEVVVKGLGSFGAITGFRQSLSAVAGIDGVALSLGQTGEFVFRATHAGGFDVRAAIVGIEGDAANIEDRPEGGLRVTLERAR